MRNFTQENGEVQITNQQQRLCQSYFIKIDQMLKAAEIKRLAKSEKFREPLAYVWDNVNMNKLAVDVVAFSSVGLDPMQKNHLHPIPYKNTALNKYDISFTKGYNGIELVAKKYGVDVPDDVVIRIVYSNEKFTPIYKDSDNKKESFIHKPSENPFDRGDIVGGYYYHVYFEHPEKNKLRVFSMNDIEKRIPKTASVEFWGGEKDTWVDGKKTGKEQVDGWRDEMVWKTLKRAAWDAINIDSQKIDKEIQNVLAQENEVQDIPYEDVSQKVEAEKAGNANRTTITLQAEEVAPESAPIPGNEAKEEPKQEGKLFSDANGVQSSGPGF
jgi:recombination protein RecT